MLGQKECIVDERRKSESERKDRRGKRESGKESDIYIERERGTLKDRDRWRERERKRERGERVCERKSSV